MMKSKTCKLTEGFRIAFDHAGLQAAEMVIAPGHKEGGPDNRPAYTQSGTLKAAGKPAGGQADTRPS